MTANASKLKSYVERLQALADAYKADVETVIDQAKADDFDAAALRRLRTWANLDSDTRNERDAIDEQYRALLTGEVRDIAIPSMRMVRVLELVKAKKTVREIAKDLGVSVGKAHNLKVQAAAFTVHDDVNMNTPDHDPTIGEVKEESCGGAESRSALPERSDGLLRAAMAEPPASPASEDRDPKPEVAPGPQDSIEKEEVASIGADAGRPSEPSSPAEQSVNLASPPGRVSPGIFAEEGEQSGTDTRTFDEIAGPVPSFLERKVAA